MLMVGDKMCSNRFFYGCMVVGEFLLIFELSCYILLRVYMIWMISDGCYLFGGNMIFGSKVLLMKVGVNRFIICLNGVML